MGVCLTQELVECYLAGNCSDEEQRAIEVHLTECEKCRQRTESTRSNMATSDQSDSAIAYKNATHEVSEESHIDQDKYPARTDAPILNKRFGGCVGI